MTQRHIGSTILALLCVPCIPVADAAEAGRGPSPETTHGDVVSVNHWTVTTGQQTRRSRRRRKRSKQRGGKYTVSAVANGGTIRGAVVFQFDAPAARKIQIVKDHEVCNKRKKLVPSVKTTDGKNVADVVVFLGDIQRGKPFAKTSKPVVNQRDCTFWPHVQVVHLDEPFDVVNSDPIAHNLHATQNRETIFNPLQPRQGMRSEFTIEEPGLAMLRCDIHNWMRAYLYVLWHPYYAVTTGDGTFELTDIPPGEYELVAWQERLGETTLKVQVEAGQLTELLVKLES